MSKRQLIDQTVHRCQFCEAAGVSSIMTHHRPLRDHYYCTGCGNVEVDWQPIYQRVEALILYEYPRSKARLAALPAAPVTRYDVPYVDGGLAISQQDSHAVADQQDNWCVHLVEQLFQCGLSRRQKQLIILRYFERWKWPQVAIRMSTNDVYVAVSTVLEWRKDVLREFARAARWA